MSTPADRRVGRPSPTATLTRSRRPPTLPVILLLAALTGAARLPTFSRPLSSDEAGFLMVASQWRPGTSLYGNYWVDRPPLLIGLFDLAGGRDGLHLLGMVAVMVSVVLAGRVGHLVCHGSRAGTLWAAVTAAVFLSTPFFDVAEIDGELLAAPFVLGGLVAALEAYAAGSARASGWWWLAAGALGAAAALVKQDMVDVFVAAAALALVLALERRGRAAVLRAGLALVGAVAVVGLALAWAATRGTGPASLWDALVTFRWDAAATISASSTGRTPARAGRLLEAAVTSGALAVVLVSVLVGRGRGRRPGALFLALSLVGWETVAVAGGGSYWLHYLVGTVPGLVACVAAATLTPGRLRWAGVAVACSAVAAVGAISTSSVHSGPRPGRDAAVKAFLGAHVRHGDTGVVAFGAPSILKAVGLSSPYEHLWSLPVRVRDPRLAEFSAVLSGPRRPTWVVVNGTSLGTWGVDPRAGEAALAHYYRRVSVDGDYRVYLEDTRAPVTAAG